MLYYTMAKAGKFAPVIRAANKNEALEYITAFVNKMLARGFICSLMLSDNTAPDYAITDNGINYAEIDDNPKLNKTVSHVTKAQAANNQINAGAWISAIQ